MAARRAETNRRNHNRTTRQSYVYGNVVTKPDYRPERYNEEPVRKKKVSSQVRKNRKKALHMGPGYVVFLTAAAVLALVICVYYVRLQAHITSQSRNITALQQELARMKEENNTKYNDIMDSVNLEDVRKKAEKKGMDYATKDQVIEYKSPSTDYVKQYEDIPEDGVIAQSDKKK